MRRDLAADEDIVAIVRGTHGESLVIVVQPGQAPVEQARICAAIGPLAEEAAPDRRINAVIATVDGDPGSVDAAVAFLESARSTTGQILTVS